MKRRYGTVQIPRFPDPPIHRFTLKNRRKFLKLKPCGIVFLSILWAFPVFPQGMGICAGGSYQNLEKPKFLAVPVPNYNESFGFGFSAVASVMYAEVNSLGLK